MSKHELAEGLHVEIEDGMIKLTDADQAGIMGEVCITPAGLNALVEYARARLIVELDETGGVFQLR